MRMTRRQFAWTAGLGFAGGIASAAASVSTPRLVRQIEFREFGSKYLRFGDLNGDGMPEAVLVQVMAPGGEDKAIITCLTAIDLEGKVLWQMEARVEVG